MQSSNPPGAGGGTLDRDVAMAAQPMAFFTDGSAPAERLHQDLSAVNLSTPGESNEGESPSKKAKREENSEVKPQKVRSYLKEEFINGDDSSDEESEEKGRSERFTASLNVEYAMQCSFLSLYLGVRILTSKEVRNLYYSLKREKLGYIAKLPGDETIRAHFNEGLRRRIDFDEKEFQKIVQSEAYSDYLQTIFHNKLQFFSFPSQYSRFNEAEFGGSLNYLRDEFKKGGCNLSALDFIEGYRRKCSGILKRPVFADSHEFLEQENDYNPTKFLANLRLDHCSAKRTLKNKEFPKTFVRNWRFGSTNQFVATNKHESSCFPGIQPKVSYDHIPNLTNSSYEHLFRKINELCEMFGMTKSGFVRNIRSLLKTGKLEQENTILEEFLTTFTFHLFGAETLRHPAALFYNVLALDLIENFGREFDLEFFPMSQKGAVGSARQIQSTLHEKLPVKYHFDYKDGYMLGLQEFQQREKYLVKTWVNCKLQIDIPNIDDWLKCKCSLCEHILLQFLQGVNGLCKDYYDIDFLSPSP